MRLRPDGRPGALLDQLQVCDDRERYGVDDRAAIEAVEDLVGWLASGLRYGA
jgi:hypothetical protein